MTKGNKRLDTETFSQYRERLKSENQSIKGWLKGRRIWPRVVGITNKVEGGTYIRGIYGKIGRDESEEVKE